MCAVSYLARLLLMFTAGTELDEIIAEKKRVKADKERDSKKDNLNLCYNHRQEQNRSHYAGSNCDHCKLQEECKRLASFLPLFRKC